MTDDDIIKALECCCDHDDCRACPIREKEAGCVRRVIRESLNLINRLQAENERLKKHNTEMAFKHHRDGAKEFAERLCEGRVSNDPVRIAAMVELEEMKKENK